MIHLHFAQGVVVSVQKLPTGVEELEVDLGGRVERALNYPELTGPAQVGCRVKLNTTAVDLGLGSGGYHFVMAAGSRQRNARFDDKSEGHIIKLRYTPHQLRCLAVEEEASPYHNLLRDADRLDGLAVVVAELHSMVAPAAAGARAALGPEACIVYIMTDAAALPLAFSRTVPELKEKGLLKATITAGQAFGGDLEAVNIFTALLAAKWALGADVAIVAMGPGVVGTGTRFGFSGVEQGQVVDAVNCLGGRPVAVLRLSAADPRLRHRGVSHHTLTALGRVAQTRTAVALPYLTDAGFRDLVGRQLTQAGITARHHLISAPGEPGLKLLEKLSIKVSSMGRDPDDDPPFFLAAAAGGWVAGQFASRGKV